MLCGHCATPRTGSESGLTALIACLVLTPCKAEFEASKTLCQEVSGKILLADVWQASFSSRILAIIRRKQRSTAMWMSFLTEGRAHSAGSRNSITIFLPFLVGITAKEFGFFPRCSISAPVVFVLSVFGSSSLNSRALKEICSGGAYLLFTQVSNCSVLLFKQSGAGLFGEPAACGPKTVYTTPACFSGVPASQQLLLSFPRPARGFFLGATSSIFSMMISARGRSGSRPQYRWRSLT